MKKIKITVREVNDLAKLFGSMLKAKGHKLTFQLSKNKFELMKILKEIEGQIELAKEPFLTEDSKAVYSKDGEFLNMFTEGAELKDGETVGHKLTAEENKDLMSALTSLQEQTFDVELIDIESKTFEEACNDGCFDALDVSDFFSFTEKMK